MGADPRMYPAPAGSRKVSNMAGNHKCCTGCCWSDLQPALIVKVGNRTNHSSGWLTATADSNRSALYKDYSKMKICTYTMTSDTGFAPNPFYGYCTLAACTPNHMHDYLTKAIISQASLLFEVSLILFIG